jgi:hypothetical protein
MLFTVVLATCTSAGFGAQWSSDGAPRNTPGGGCTEVYAQRYYCRAGAYQYVAADGAYVSTPVLSPTVQDGDLHSLAELAVLSADHRQVIEIGWRIYRPQDQQPRLFIFHWIDGKGTCYNTGCGFVQNGTTTVRPGMVLAPSSRPVQFAIRYFQGNWWYGYDGSWFGYLPGSLWKGGYTRMGMVQIYGEVVSTTARPCTDMGNGNTGTSTLAAAMTGVGYYDGSSAVLLARASWDDRRQYDSRMIAPDGFRYGGPGSC